MSRIVSQHFVAIGMAKISSCKATVYKGQYVKRGDLLGMFHWRGSIVLLLFNKGAQFTINDKYHFTKEKQDTPIHVNKTIGFVADPPEKGPSDERRKSP
jgi:hypothetical protein